MGKPIHPDRLDAVAASQDASVRHQVADEEPAGEDEVRTILTKLLTDHGWSNFPKKRRPRNIVLASVPLLMVRYRAYNEAELTHILQRWLGAANLSADHATCRRYLIDHGLVKRDRAGNRYIADYSRIEALLSADALVFAKELVARAVDDEPSI